MLISHYIRQRERRKKHNNTQNKEKEVHRGYCCALLISGMLLCNIIGDINDKDYLV
jgi:hypothetical protein